MEEVDKEPRPRFPFLVQHPGGGEGEGFVTIDFFIDEVGRVQNPVAREGSSKEYADYVLREAAGWQFFPAQLKGVRVAVKAQYHVSFGRSGHKTSVSVGQIDLPENYSPYHVDMILQNRPVHSVRIIR